ncbi:MAG TPA: YraN family protein [bacterium]|nr:YraN family protein [bacterium]
MPRRNTLRPSPGTDRAPSIGVGSFRRSKSGCSKPRDDARRGRPEPHPDACRVRAQRDEDATAAALRGQRYRILGGRVRLRCGELDTVADDRGTSVFVEVKTRSSRAYGTPAEAITSAKQPRPPDARPCSATRSERRSGLL